MNLIVNAGGLKSFLPNQSDNAIRAIFSNPYRYILGYLFLAKLKKKMLKRNEEVVRCLKWRGWKNVRRKILKSKWTKKQPHGLRLQLTIPMEKPPTCEEREAKRIKKKNFWFIPLYPKKQWSFPHLIHIRILKLYIYVCVYTCVRVNL